MSRTTPIDDTTVPPHEPDAPTGGAGREEQSAAGRRPPRDQHRPHQHGPHQHRPHLRGSRRRSTGAHRASGTSEGDRLLRRMTLASAFGQGLDGFDLGIISVIVTTMSHDLHIGPGMMGLIGASSLIGILFGSPVAGALTDRFGRKRMFLLNMISFVAIGVAQAFVTNGVTLLVLRLILGVAIGAEYAIGGPLLAEFAPTRGRGRRLSFLEACWYVGFLVSVLVGYGLTALGVHWRWVLATSAVPALIALVLRSGIPESPRWLISKGRDAEARKVIDDHLGGERFFHFQGLEGEEVRDGGFANLFKGRNLSRTIFVCVFWACLVAPYFAIFTFAPVVLDAMNMHNETAATIGENAIAAIGALVGVLAIERIGRRRMLIVPLWVQAGALALIGFWHDAPAVVGLLCLAVFAFLNAFACDLCAVYPSEVFPTEVRSSGMGIASSASRLGAAAGTWLLPMGIQHLGIGPCLVIGAAVCVVGAVVSQVMAPETTGHSLSEAHRVEARAS